MADRLLRRKGRSSKDGRHVRLYHNLLKTAAWQSLSANARAIYVEIAQRYCGTNNGHIPYSIREAASSLHIGKTTAYRALRELQDRGFIVFTTKGAFSRKVRHATEWRLTEFVSNVDDQLATKEFMCWVPEKQNTVPVAKPSVPQAKPFGPSCETVKTKTPGDGISSETVVADKNSSRFHHGYTNSLPVGCGVSGHSLPGHSQPQTGCAAPFLLAVEATTGDGAAGGRSSIDRLVQAQRASLHDDRRPVFAADREDVSCGDPACVEMATLKQGRPPSENRINARLIFANAAGALSIADVATRLGVQRVDANALIQSMLAAGEIMRRGRGVYLLASKSFCR
jgi:predicted transcriptional regulator